MVEWEARCLALEQAYVHEVYYQMGGTEAGGGTRQTPPWPRVTHFLNQLEPGSIVCDVGCGSGKYLSINPSVFKVGVDRCSRLAETAREEDNEVLICDNLSLPFRDESFDAVLSIAVIHHFATTERRVGALKELARILRIGGRLVITVWAMEQRHRKFESQDVLVPWHRPQTVSSPSLELTPTTTTSEEESHHHPYTACTHTSDSDSAPSARASRGKRRSKHNEVISSPSNSSLSSPNESCYSFVRRALKKLAGVKRGNPRGRPWFLDSWTSCSSSKEPPPRRYDPDGCEDIQDLPIELRRLEENSELPFRTPILPSIQQVVDPLLNQKSKSLSDIITVDQKSLVRSQSSFPNLEARDRSPKCEELFMNKPRLIKQKKSFCVEDIESEDRDEATDMKELIDSLPEFRSLGLSRKGNVFKQSSMNEELMSVERLREKERVRQNIQKQASLNEELIYSRNNRTLDSLRDTLFSTSTAKRLQLLKNGLTNKIKSSTTGIEKVAGASIKNGFVRILQGWTGSEVTIQQPPQPPPPPPSTSNSELKSLKCEGKKEEPERRHSREDGSDSSKDSSLQSDTSVDSEDSFASVIFIPKADAQDQQSSTTSPTMQSNPASPQPTSPKIKFPPPISPKLKTNNQMSFGLPHPSSPKIKHPNQLISTSPSSPKVKYFPPSSSPKPFQTNYITTSTSRNSFKFQPSSGSSTPQVCKTAVAASKSLPPTYKIPHLTPTSPSKDPFKEISPTRKQETDSAFPEIVSSSFLKDNLQSEEEAPFVEIDLTSSPRVSPLAEEAKPLAPPEPGPSTKNVTVKIEEEPPSLAKENTKSHKGITHSKSCVRSQFPLVRRSSSVYGKGESGETLPVARLLSLEIFNPETDDMDSDSSGLSSPDSVGSVISIKNDDETVTDNSSELKNMVKNEESVPGRTSGVGAEKYPQAENIDENRLKLEENTSQEVASSPKLSPLLEAAVDVANTLEETVEAVIQSSPQAKRKNLPSKSDSRHYLQEQKVYFIDKSFEKMKEEALKEESSMLSPTTKKLIEVPRKLSLDIKEKDAKEVEEHRGKRWDEECRQHLADFAEKLSEKLLAEIDRYRELHSNIRPMSSGNSKMFSSAISRDPYLFKLNEDLNKLTRLSIELQEDVVPCRIRENVARVKGEGATVEEKHIESKRRLKDPVVKIELPDTCFVSTSSGMSCPFLEEEYRPLLEEFDSTNSLVASSNFSRSTAESLLSPDAEIQRERERRREEEYLHSYYSQAIVKEKLSETFEPDNLYIDETWAESRRNPVLPSKVFSSLHSIEASNRKEETTKIELLRAKDVPRRPSISIEMSESLEKLQKDRDDLPSETQLHLGISLESSEAGDISEKTGSSSDGSRPGSRRDTIHISHSGSVLSLRPGLSIESSEAGDISASDLSRRDILGQSDLTSSSQNSLLRPGNSIESSDAGDVSDRTGSDVSRQNTSSTGKTASAGSTASIASASDKASDCSKDARFADRRMARCDGRSSSEEMPTSKSSLNKLVRQRASTHEPPEILAKAQSCETSISGSTSQDSLLSDSGGGAITFHRYYHVFREGELDSLIERYVENLHIISSYYDHANWCIIAEKVQVWTI